MGKICKSIVRTGVAYKRGEKRTEKVKEQKQKQKGSIKRTEREQREREEKERKEYRTGSVIDPYQKEEI